MRCSPQRQAGLLLPLHLAASSVLSPAHSTPAGRRRKRHPRVPALCAPPGGTERRVPRGRSRGRSLSRSWLSHLLRLGRQPSHQADKALLGPISFLNPVYSVISRPTPRDFALAYTAAAVETSSMASPTDLKSVISSGFSLPLFPPRTTSPSSP